MGQNVILCDREDIRTVELEEQLAFVFSTLVSMGIPEEDVEACRPAEGGLSVEQKISLRELCKHFAITLLDDSDGGLKIYLEVTQEDGKTKQQILVAEWKKPWFVLKTDPSVLDRSKRFYAEIHISWWSLQEEQDG